MNNIKLLVKPSDEEDYLLISKNLIFQLLSKEITLLSEAENIEKCSASCLNQGAMGLLKWVEAFNLAAKPPKK
jgi:hypothetical protein|tara:strand:- start:265 stop:483 length:219 start_codon:yes stop_codon:yes gene_type:complete